MNIKQKYGSYAIGKLYTHTLLDHALIADAHGRSGRMDSTSLQEILLDAITNNKIIKRLLTVMEIPTASSLPVLDSSVYKSYLEQQQSRGPLNSYQQDGIRAMVSTLLDVKCVGTCVDVPEFMKVGHTVPRDNMARQQGVLANAYGLMKDLADTVEMLMFPYLFPQGTGYFRGGESIHDYAKFRAKQAFSMFTLLPQYILTLFHLRQATLFRNQTSMCVDKQYQN
jgi:hypothetical protein